MVRLVSMIAIVVLAAQPVCAQPGYVSVHESYDLGSSADDFTVTLPTPPFRRTYVAVDFDENPYLILAFGHLVASGEVLVPMTLEVPSLPGRSRLSAYIPSDFHYSSSPADLEMSLRKFPPSASFGRVRIWLEPRFADPPISAIDLGVVDAFDAGDELSIELSITSPTDATAIVFDSAGCVATTLRSQGSAAVETLRAGEYYVYVAQGAESSGGFSTVADGEATDFTLRAGGLFFPGTYSGTADPAQWLFFSTTGCAQDGFAPIDDAYNSPASLALYSVSGSNVFGPPPLPFVDSGTMVMDLPGGIATSEATLPVLSGDFDVSIDFEADPFLEVPPGELPRFLGLRAARASDGAPVGAIERYRGDSASACIPFSNAWKAWTTDPDDCVATFVNAPQGPFSDPDRSVGRLRLRREGSALSMGFETTDYVEVLNETVTVDDVLLTVFTGNGAVAGHRVAFDNLRYRRITNETIDDATSIGANSVRLVDTTCAVDEHGPASRIPVRGYRPVPIDGSAWYSFTATETSVEITTSGSVSSVIGLYTGLVNPTLLAADQGSGVDGARLCAHGLVPGDRYYIQAGSVPDAIADAVFVLGVTSPAPMTPPVLYVDAGATGSEDGSSWADAMTELSEAVRLVECRGGPAEIWVAQGVFTPGPSSTNRSQAFVLTDGLEIYGGFPSGGGDGTFDARDPAVFPTVLSGDIAGDDPQLADNARHIIVADGVSDVVVSGVTIRGGRSDGALVYTTGRGGGVLSLASDCRFDGCVIEHNSASAGGGVMISDGTARLLDCLVQSNEAEARGGGIAIAGANGSIRIDRSTVTGNTAAFGGGIDMATGSSLIGESCVFTANTATWQGSALCVQGSADLSNSLLVSNTGGHAIATMDADVIRIANATVVDNSAGIAITGAPTPSELLNSIVRDNGEDYSNTTAVADRVDSCNIPGYGMIGMNIDAPAGFVDPGGGDYRLRAGSKCIDAADSAVIEPCGGFGGREAEGEWLLTISDRAPADIGELFSWTVSINGGAVTNTSTTPIPLPDLATVFSTLDVPTAATITDIEISLDIVHSHAGDLVVTVTSPDGTTVPLMYRVGLFQDLGGQYTFSDGASQTLQDGVVLDSIIPGAYRATGESGFLVDLNETGCTTTDLAGSPRFVDDAGISNRILDIGAYEFQGVSPCPCDRDADGSITVTDLLSFLSAWFPLDPASDENANGVVTVEDLLIFLSCWFFADAPPDCG